MLLVILLIVFFPIADFAKANGPLDIVVLCDESKYMELIDSRFYYENFAKFVEQFLPQANSLNFYAIVGCGKPETRRKEKRHVPFESIKIYCKSSAENERNYDKCLLYADHENIFVLDEENRPNVNDVFFIVGDGLVDVDLNVASVAVAVREYADIFYFYTHYALETIGEKNFYNRQLQILANITGDQDKVILFDEEKFDQVFDNFIRAICYAKFWSGACYVEHTEPAWKCIRRVKKQQEKLQDNFECPHENMLETIEKCPESECPCDDLYPWKIVAECSATDCKTQGEIVYIREVPDYSACQLVKHEFCFPTTCTTVAPARAQKVDESSESNTGYVVVISVTLISIIAIIVLTLIVIQHKKPEGRSSSQRNRNSKGTNN